MASPDAPHRAPALRSPLYLVVSICAAISQASVAKPSVGPKQPRSGQQTGRLFKGATD
jgi:hypothetical protein